MSQLVRLSNQKQTQALKYLITDKQQNYFSNEKRFNDILNKLLSELNEEDKQIAILQLNQIFPGLNLQYDMTDSIICSSLNSSLSKSHLLFDTNKVMQGQKVLKIVWDLQFQDELEIAKKNQDWAKLKQIIQYNQFYSDGKYPCSFLKLVPLIEKLKSKSFILIDLADSFMNCQFQLNLTIIRNLLYYFYIPNELNLTKDELQEIEQLLGEIINLSWLQFEYHQYQLTQNNYKNYELNNLKDIPNMLTQTPQEQREKIENEFQKIVHTYDKYLLQAELEYYIAQELPIISEVQRIYYLICFYFMSVFHQQYKKNKRLYETERNRLLNSYIEEKTQQNSEEQTFSDCYFYDNQLEKCFVNYQVQQTLSKIRGKGIDFRSNEQILQYFIDTNFYYFNKQIHIVDKNENNKHYAKILNLLTEISDEDKRKIATLITKVIQESQDIDQIIDDLCEQKYQYDEEQLEIIFRIICEMLYKNFEEFWTYRNALKRNFKKKYFNNLQLILYIQQSSVDQQIINLTQNQDKEFWQILQQNFQKLHYQITNNFIELYKNQNSEYSKDIFQILKENSNYNNNGNTFLQLIKNLEDSEVNQLLIYNDNPNYSLENYLSTFNILVKLMFSISNKNDREKLITNLNSDFYFCQNFRLDFLMELIDNNTQKDILNKIYTLVYYYNNQNKNQLQQEAEALFKNDPEFYEKTFSKFQYFQCEEISVDYLKELQEKPLDDNYPNNLQINLEEFNISQADFNQLDQLVYQWIQDIKNEQRFKDLLPFYINMIQNEESSTTFIAKINEHIQNDQELSSKYGYFNFKSMFQLLYNNSDEELQCFLLKQISQNNPIPFLYKVPQEDKTKKIEQFKFNLNTQYIHQKSFTIINLSLQQIQKRIGKTQLINNIFFQSDKFEILDNNKLNDNTIDIIYNCEFQGIKNLSIADAHNFIPLKILDDILPLFKLWIIQLNTQKDIDPTISILEQLSSFYLEDKIVCFLIRDSSTQLEQAKINKLRQLNIEYQQVVNLTDNNLNKYVVDNEIKKVREFVQDLIEKNQNNNIIDTNQFCNVISQMKNESLKKTSKKDEELQEKIELQQNEDMREKFNELMKTYTFPEKSLFIESIQQQIQENIQYITSDNLQLIKQQQFFNADYQFELIQNQIFEILSTYEREKYIKHQIIQKYNRIIQEKKNGELQACKLAIYLEIQKHLEILNKNEQQQLIQEEIKKIQQDPNMMKELKDNPKKVEDKYNKIVRDNKEKQDEASFVDLCNFLFQNIQSQFTAQSECSPEQENYKKEFYERIIKKQPNEQDYILQYNILEPELQQYQFKVLEKTDKNQYFEIFTQSIQNKLANSAEKPILSINKFYVKIIKCIKKQNIDRYMADGDILKDFESEIKNKNNDKQFIQAFLAKFTIFNFEIIDEKVDQLCLEIQNGIENKKKLEYLLQCVKPIEKQGTNIILNESSIEKIQNNCYYFKKVLNQFEIIEFNDYSEIDYGILKDCYLIETNPQVQRNLKYSNQFKIDVFNYIMDQQKDLASRFVSNIVEIMSELMNDEEQHSWRIMYEQIFQTVYDAIKNTVTASQDNFGGQIKMLIQILDIQITDLNEQFSQFGVILNAIGEKCIINFALFMFWRIVCFKHWEQRKKNEQIETNNLEKALFIKFKADLFQDKQEQSKQRGKQQASEILMQQKQRLYQSYKTEVKDLIANYDTETSFDLIQRLDREILERQNNSIDNSQILKYVMNHAEFIKNYLSKNLDQIKSTIQSKLTKKLKDDMKLFFERIIQNTKKLNDFKQNLAAQEYFVKLQNPDEAPALLYQAVLGCMQGAIDQDIIRQIKPDMIQGFQIEGCYRFPFILKNPLQNKLYEEIYILNDFIQSFNEVIQNEMKLLDQLNIDFGILDIQSSLNALLVKQLGCQISCPICKRKCDLELDKNHKHQCRNGHQLRGMSGVLIGSNPSLFTCEEIQDYCQVQIKETKLIKYWGEVKTIYNEWLFSCMDVTEKKVFLKKKFTNIWNLNIGQMICKQLTQEIGQEIQFISQEAFDNQQLQRAPKAIHYVIILDDSGSMQGEKFDNAKAGIIAFLAEIHKMRNKDSRVTIIIFNGRARVVVDSEVINPKEQEQKITFEGGGTNFDEPFTKAYEKIIQRPDFDKFHQHSMFFYTDGDASYPQKALGLFEQLSPEQKQKIELIACSQEKKPSLALQQVVTFFKEKNFSYAELKHSIEPEQIGSTWIETISQKTHQLQKLG